jgi:hypothetical protein
MSFRSNDSMKPAAFWTGASTARPFSSLVDGGAGAGGARCSCRRRPGLRQGGEPSEDRRYLDGIAAIDDATIFVGVRFALERMKQLVETAGAAALAAVLFGEIPIRDGERGCVVFTGGNAETARLGDSLAGAAPLEIPPAVG